MGSKGTRSALGVQKLQQFSQLTALWEQLFQGINTLFLTFLLYNLSQAVSWDYQPSLPSRIQLQTTSYMWPMTSGPESPPPPGCSGLLYQICSSGKEAKLVPGSLPTQTTTLSCAPMCCIPQTSETAWLGGIVPEGWHKHVGIEKSQPVLSSWIQPGPCPKHRLLVQAQALKRHRPCESHCPGTPSVKDEK